MKNILVLSLSTFNSNIISKSFFRLDDTTRQEYYYQLEPIPLMLNNSLQKSGEALDVIIALATPETKDPQNITLDFGNGQKDNLYTSAEEFFRTRLQSMNVLFEYIPIDITPSSPDAGIIRLLTTLQKQKAAHSDINLYIDNHGGFRDTQIIFQAILTLLKNEEIQPKEIFTGQYSTSEKAFIIQSGKTAYDINMFVSGMNEFINFGRSQNLELYFTARGINDTSLLTHIRRISDSIQLCDVVGFDNAVSKMKEWLQLREKTPDEYVEAFLHYIEEDYRPMWENRNSILKKVKWCMRKGFVQQALTIIESKMPEKIMQRLITYNNQAEELTKDSSGKFTPTGRTYRTANIIPKCKKDWELTYNYMLERWAYRRIRQGNHFIQIGTEDLNNPRNYSITPCQLELSDSNNNNKKYRISFTVNVSAEHLNKLGLFLDIHMALKEQRNMINHSSAKGRKHRASIEQLSNAINTYIDLAELFGVP